MDEKLPLYTYSSDFVGIQILLQLASLSTLHNMAGIEGSHE